jgi:hypothetical protein
MGYYMGLSGHYMGLSGHFRAPVALVLEETAPHYTLDSKLSRFQCQSRHGGEKKNLFPCL